MSDRKDPVTRRQFLKCAGSTLLGALVVQCVNTGVGSAVPADPTLTAQAWLPLVTSDHEPPTDTPTPTSTNTPTPTATNTPTPTSTSTPSPTSDPTGGPRVIHVHDASATNWNFGSNYYGNYVNQGIVNAMVDRGMKELTNTSTVGDAWRAILPSYTPGQGIAIKVNFNNWNYCDRCETNCEEWTLKTDALIHPVIGVIQGLKQAYTNLAERDIWVYDATVGHSPPVSERQIPDNVFVDPCHSLYPGVRFFDQGCQEEAGYASTNPSANITWRNPGGIPAPPSRKVTDVLVNATYVINMPIMKKHAGTEITLGFKNHAGSLSNFSPFHAWVYYDGSNYSSSYNPLVDIYRNPNIQNKTVLTIGDGLFGNWYRNETKSEPWMTFGNQAANSLLFATDPVAIDCVMCDLLDAESVERGLGHLRAMADDYLVLASNAGLGIYERGAPWGSGYTQIDYVRVSPS